MAHHRLVLHQVIALAAATSLVLLAAASPVHTTATPPAAVFRGGRRLGPAATSHDAPAPAAALLPSDDGKADGYMIAFIFFWIAYPFLVLLGWFVCLVLAYLLYTIFRKVAALLGPFVAGDNDDQDGAEAP